MDAEKNSTRRTCQNLVPHGSSVFYFFLPSMVAATSLRNSTPLRLVAETV